MKTLLCVLNIKKDTTQNHITVIKKDNCDQTYNSVTALIDTPTLNNLRSLVGKMNTTYPSIIFTSLSTNFVHQENFDSLRENNIEI